MNPVPSSTAARTGVDALPDAPAGGTATATTGTDVLDRFHPAVATWFRRRFPEGPTEPQIRGWPAIAAGDDTLIAAPTGSGKTLSGFLVAIDALYRAHEAGTFADDVTRVVYVSPLKALAVDIAENLDGPLAEIAAIATELGHQPPNIRVAVRTGDTTSSERTAMVKRPPSFIVTTPESLYLLLTSDRGRQALRTTETVIVDEIHAVARDKRGAHLALSLERLEALCDRRPLRIGLSATQRPIETVADLLVGDRPAPTVVDAGHLRDLDLALELPEGELEAVASAEQMGDVLDRIAAHVADHRTTLVFVNTRRLAERLAHQLGERLGEDAVAAHHGSLSRERRQRVENRLRAGDLRALVCTASLELGIDIGPVELVCQIGSPRSIATFLQRVGRSNHSRAGTPKGRLYPLTRDELVECAALLGAVRAGRLDRIVPSKLPLDIVAQQLVAEVGAQEWRTDDLYELVRRAAHFTGLDRNQFDQVLDLVSEGVETGRGRRGAYLHHDGINGEVRPRKGARLAATTSGGAIPETGDYRVVAEPEDTLIGTVGEDWAIESMAGDVFTLGTHSWQIRKVEAGVVRVRDAGDTPPTIPFWVGEAPARTDELSAEVSDLRATVDDHLTAGQPDRARSWLMETAGLEPDAATMIVDYLAVGRAALGAMPTVDRLVLERFFDETGGMQLVLHSPLGGRINRALGLSLRKKFCRTFDFELQAAATDDALVLSLGPHHSFPLDEVPRYVHSRSVQETLEQAVLASPMFQARWRWNLNRSLLVLRFKGGRRHPAPLQRMESDDLLAAVFPQAAACQENVTGPVDIPDHLLVRQTLDDALHEAMDIDGTRALLERLEAGEVTVHCVDTTEPSALSHEILTARPYAFLDDEGEIQNRRTSSVVLPRGLSVDLAAIGRIDPEAVAQVHREIDPAPQGPDELHDLLSALVLVPARADWWDQFEQLTVRGRAQVIERSSAGGDDLWCTTEGLERARRALAGDDEAVSATVRGHLEISGITTVDQLVRATGLPPGRVRSALASLESEGFVFQGRYTDDARDAAQAAGEGADTSVEWVARRLLARMHAMSRRSRRASVEPVTAQTFMRFLLRWHHVAPGTQLPGDAVLTVLEQLQGYEAAAVAWEPDLLKRRLHHYDPSHLDQLCHAGEVAWLRLTPPDRAGDTPATAPSKATPIAVVLRHDLEWLLLASRCEGPPTEPEAGATIEILDHLRDRGASFAGDLATATRRLPDDIERGLWDGVARGLVMCDGFAAVRARVDASGGAARPQGRSGPLDRPGAGRRASAAGLSRYGGRRPGRQLAPRRRAGLVMPPGAAGRWSAVPLPASADADADAVSAASADGNGASGTSADEPGDDRHDLAEAVAEQLLARWGVVFRDLAVHDSLGLPWREVQWAFRRLEDRGLVRGGRFVAGFSGEQYALPAAADQLNHLRSAPTTGERVTVNATDPLNLVGVIVPGETVPAIRTNQVTFVDGIPT